jgi:hypothetical protein
VKQPVDRVLTWVSAVLLPLGLLVVLLGWYGAAHTPYLFEQVPYLISGGLLGLALVTGAGLLYFGGWVARSSSLQARASEEALELLREIRDGLAAAPVRAPASTTGDGFVATARGSMWHRPDCPVVAGREDLHHVGPDGGGLRPCSLCDPLAAVPAQPATRGSSR